MSSPIPVQHDLATQQEAALRIHAAVFGASMAIIFLVNLLTNASAGIMGEVSAWWSLWALVGWGAGLGVHWAVVRLARSDFASYAASRPPREGSR